MAKKQKDQISSEQSENRVGAKYPLLVYHFIAMRYRPAGVLLFVVGLLALLPWLIPQLRFRNAILNYTQLALVGIGGLSLGVAVWIITIFMERRAYVQCRPEYMVIRTAFHTIAVAYQRFNTIQPVQDVRHIYDLKAVKGRERTFIKPLAGNSALEAFVSDYPVSENRLHRHFSQFLFSPRGKGFVFIVSRPQQLSHDLNACIQQVRDSRNEAQTRYLDPIERLRHQNTGNMY